VREEADSRDYIMVRTPAGLAFAPKTPEGETMSREQYSELSQEEQKGIDEGLSQLNQELQQVMRLVRQEEKAGREALRELDEQVSTYAAKHLVEEVKERWREIDEISEYLDHFLEDVIENADDFKKGEEESPAVFMGVPVSAKQRTEAAFRKYQVNVLVDNSGCLGAPVVCESNPTLQQLVGRVEHLAQFGALVTDFNMIKPGSLHAANGGFLMLEARELLMKPYAWDALKRSLKTREIAIEDVAKQLGMATTATLDPEPIPLDCKIVLVGDPFLYYLLYSLDPDFEELFNVIADFDTVAERTLENERLYGSFVANVCRAEALPPFSAGAVARVIEQGSRWASDQHKLSTRFLDVSNLVREAAYWARRRDGRTDDVLVTESDVQRAVDESVYRSNRVEERIRELITQGTILVDTAGDVVGQINGLSVSSVGDYAFGNPSRITATHRLGEGEVVDIEREVEMGGPIHSKGVLILAGYLGSKYASDWPLSLSVRLVFEQSYSGVEGDSASSAELYAILSSLSDLPIQQRFAVTGSVNQRGQVQAIGGVNEKVEGFFAVCRERGLRGDEGVLIPAANVRHLMLKREVREAVAAGRFHIYPVSTIDEGISILTGVDAGPRDPKGDFPEGSVNARVARRLAELAERRRQFNERADSNGHDGGDGADGGSGGPV
jgi:lon-related putative ATP-dependent protease